VTETRQLEFINAGWCMNDEAATDYNAIIDQMSIGLRFVEKNFGPSARPRVGWHIDPFGHSSQMASIHSLLGMDGFFFARIDYDDKNRRLSDKTMEMVWQSSPSLGAAGDIFTGVLYYFYGPPPGFCFDVRCSDQPIQDDPKLFGYNVDERVAGFVRAAQEQAAHYASNHIMFTMGSDFNYESALEWYKNLDKLIRYVNKMSDEVEVFYSTPSRYLDALNKLNLTWTTKNDDFFPYADNPHSYWTGYFTSRPALKGYTRVSNSLLQTCKQAEVLGESPTLHRHTQASSVTLAQAMGVDQHHDAVSGTEKQHVADDYARRLHVGQVECQELINDVLMAYLTSGGTQSPSFEFCEYLNVSYCPVTETNSFNVMAYNPIGRKTVAVMGFPVTSDSVEVLDENGEQITAQLIPISEGTKKARGNRGEALYDLLFPGLLRPLGLDLFLVRPTKSGRGTSTVKSREYVPEPGADFTIDNGVMTLTFSGATGRLMMMENKVSKISAKVDQNFLWWNSSAGNNVNSSQTSGAYIFRPNGTAPFEINGSIVKTRVIDGPVLTAVIQEWAPWLYQTISLLKSPASPTAIFSYIVGPIPFQDGLGKEIISRFTTDLNTKSKFYTDSNGRQMLERVRNYRPTWKYNNTEPVTGNYYPVDSRIFIKDEDRGVQFTVMTDRAQGGSSLNDGQLELMVHRRTLYDDFRGVGEPLNETGQTGEGLIITGVHVAILDNFVNSNIYHRIIGEQCSIVIVQETCEVHKNFTNFMR
jgi:lysosomal alpha-mannosidase